MKKIRIILGFLSTFVFGILGTNIALADDICRKYTLKSYDADYEKTIYYSNGKIYADSSCDGTPITELTDDYIPKMDGYTFVAWVSTKEPDIITDWKIDENTDKFHSIPTFRRVPKTDKLTLVSVDSLKNDLAEPIINAAWAKKCQETVENGSCILNINALSETNPVTYTTTCDDSTTTDKILPLNEGSANIQCIKYNAQLSCLGSNDDAKYLLYVTEQTDIYSENVEVLDLDDNLIKKINIKDSMVEKCGLEGDKDYYDLMFSTAACVNVNVDDSLDCDVDNLVDCTFDEDECFIHDLKTDEKPTFDIMLYWEEKTYNVTFSCGTDATGDLEDKSVEQTNGSLSLPTEKQVKAACSREKYTADGFINKETGENYSFGEYITINSDAEFEVKWKPVLVKITFKADINTMYADLNDMCTGGYNDTQCAINIMKQPAAWPTQTPYSAVKPYYNNGKWHVLTGWKYENGTYVYKFNNGELSAPTTLALPTGDVTLVPIWTPASCVPAADGHIVSASVEKVFESNVYCTYSCAEHYIADSDYYNNEYQTGKSEHSVKCKPKKYSAKLISAAQDEYFTDENGQNAGPTMHYEHGSDYKIKLTTSDNRLLTGWDISCSDNSGCYIDDITTSANNRVITLGAGTYGNLIFKPNFATPKCNFENAASAYAELDLDNNTVTCNVTCKSGYIHKGESVFSIDGEQNQANLSGRCVLECADGERLSEDGKTCQDINENEFALFFYCDKEAAGNAYNADGIADVMSNYPADDMYIFDTTNTDIMMNSSVNNILETENIVPRMCQKDYLKVNNNWTAENSGIDTAKSLSDLYSVEEGYEHTVFYATYSVPYHNSKTHYVKKDASVVECPYGSRSSNKITVNIDGSDRTIYTGCKAKPGYSCTGIFDPEEGTFTDGGCTAIEYTITYKDNNNQTITDLDPTTYTVDTGVPELPTPPAPNGYEFNSWKRNGVAVTKIDTEMTGDIVLVATYNLKGATVNINIANKHGKNLLINDSIYTNAQKDSVSFTAGDDTRVGDIQVEITNNTNDMYRFDGFYSDPEYRNKVDANTLLSEEPTLYAKVLSTEFNVNYYCNNIFAVPNWTTECEYDERGFASECKPVSYEDTGCTIRDNQTFEGWIDDNDNVYYPGDGKFSQEHTSDTNLRPIIKDKFNICLKSYRGKCANLSSVPETCTDGKNVQIPVYPDVLMAALGNDKVYTNIALINGIEDPAKSLIGTTPGNDDERINFTCNADLRDDHTGVINIELKSCPSCQSNDSATCNNVSMNGDNCTYSYKCKTGYHYGENNNILFDSITNNDRCTPNTYTVKFDANKTKCDDRGGNVTPETMSEMTVDFATPTPITGPTFACSTAELSGWSTDPNATKADMMDKEIILDVSDIDNIASDGTITLYAIWGKKSFSIKTDQEVSETCQFPSVWTNGDNLLIPGSDCVSKPYYINAGWIIYAFDAKGTKIGETPSMGNPNFLNAVISMQLKETPAYFEIKPDWKPVQYKAVFEGGDSETIANIQFDATTEGLKVSNLPANPQTGYKFAQWCVFDDANTKHCFNPGTEIFPDLFADLLTIAANNSDNQVKFHASFVPETYEITLTTGDGGNFYNDSGNNEGETKVIYQKYANSFYSDKEETTQINAIPAPIRQGYKFAGYYTADGKSVSNGILDGFVNGTATFSENTTVSAHWVPITYSVSLNWDGNLTSVGQEQTLEPVLVFEVYDKGWYSDSDANVEMDQEKMNLIENQELMSKQHYTFNGFFTGKNGNGTKVIDNTGKADYFAFGNTDSTNTLFAYWTKTCYPVELYNGKETVGKIYYTKQLYSDGTETNTWYSDSACSMKLTAASLPSITPETGYQFRGWTAEPVEQTAKLIYRGESDIPETVYYIPSTANWVFDAAGKPANNASTFSGTALHAHNSNQYNVTFKAPIGTGTTLGEVCLSGNGFICDASNSVATTTFIYDADNLYKLPVTPYLDSTNSGDTYYMLGWTQCADDTCKDYSNDVQWPVKIPSNTAKDLYFTAYFKYDANVCPADNSTVLNAIVSKDTIDEKNGIFFNCSYTCKPGYTFEGTDFANVDANEIVTLSSNFFLGDTNAGKPASCTPKVWPIKFDLNGGTGTAPTAADVIFTGQTPTLSDYEEPSRIGYTFLGWFWEGIVDGQHNVGSDVQIYTTSGQPINQTWANIPDIDKVGLTVKNGETIVVRALWKPKTYTITFNKNCQNDTCTLDGDKNALIADETLEYDAYAFYTPTEEYARSGYAFAGWSLDKNATTGWGRYTELTGADIINDTNKNNSEIVLYAIWQPKTYKINLLPNHNSDTQITVYEKYATGWCTNRQCSEGTIPSIPVPERTGYTFTGYYTASQGGEIKFAPTQDENGDKIIVLNANNATLVTDNYLDTPVDLYAQWVANKYTVTLSGNNGNVTPANITVTYDSESNIDGFAASRVGYNFVGLYDEATGGTKYFDEKGNALSKWNKTTPETTLYAQWDAKQSTVKFLANGGTLKNANGEVIQNSEFSLVFVYDKPLKDISGYKISRSGYRFGGWTDDSGNKYYNALNTPDKDSWDNEQENVTLKAVWTKMGASNVNINPNSGILSGYTLVESCVEDTPTWLLPTADQISRVGYIFNGWKLGDETVTHVEQGICKENTTLTYTAQWIPITYTVSFKGNNSTSGTMNNQTFEFGETQSLSANKFERNNYEFIGWSTNKNATVAEYKDGQEFANTDMYNSLAVENKTVYLYAIWQPKTYNIIINWNNNNDRSDTPIKLVYGVQWLDASNNELINIEPATKAGYKFNGIKYNDIVIVDKEGNLQMGNALKAITEDNVTITPTWVANTYTVTIDDNDNDNQVVISPLSTTVTYGKKTNINGFSVNRIGYSLTGLYDSTNTGATQYFDAFGNATTEWDKDADTTLYAQWKAHTYTVKFDTTGGGELDDATWEYGTAYKAKQPSARTGYEFDGWKTDDGETFNKNAYISNLTTINGHTVTLTAIWKPKSYILDYTCGEMGSAKQDEMTVRDISYGKPYTFWNGDVCHRDGYDFNGWTIFGNLNADESISTGPYNSGAITTWKFDNISGVLTADAQWTPKTYTITYNCNGGKGGETTQNVQMGAVVDIRGKICNKPGYKFVGWFNSAEDGQGTQFKDTLNWSTADDITLYAHWEQSKNTQLNYNLSTDETLVSDDDSYNSCNVLTKRELPKAVKNGSEFVGWCIGSDKCESPITVFNEGECNFTSDDAELGQEVQLYPVFNKNTYKLYYYCGVAEECDDENACGAVSGEITQLQTEIQYGDTLQFPAIASGCNSTGYELLGWQIEHSNRYDPDTGIVWELTDRESYTIYPVWKPAKFTVSFDANTTDGNGYAINSVTCKYNNWTNTCVSPDYITGTLENGTKYFAGWSKEKDAKNPTIAAGEHLDRIATTDTTLYAIYIDCPNAENIGGAMSKSIDTVNNVCKYAVTCSANTIKPTIVYDEAASKWIASCSACPDHSTSPEGNTLDVCACAHGYTSSSNGNVCLANLYSIIYYLDGGVNYANAPAQYQYGQIKTIDGIPTKKGYVFGGWCDGNLENCATSKTISATDLGDKAFYAKWTPITYKLYYNGNGASNGVKMDATTCTYNKPCTLSANEFIKPGHKFKHWTLGDKNNQLFENRANVTNMFDEYTETTLYAQWTPCDSDVSGECDCASDEHPVNGVCSSCTIYCDSTDKDYPKGHYYVCNSSKETAEAACYRDLTPADIPNSFSVFGMMFRSKLMSVQPNNLTCEDGYYPSDDWTSCEKCQAGYYCPQESGKNTCPSEYPLSADGAVSIDECYKECESIISGQIVMAPDARWVYYGEECEYTRNIETPEGICVKLEDDTCAEYVSCKPGYKLNGTQCELCDVEGAVSYSSGCKVLTCVTGYHAVGETCESNITDCSQQIANATVATQNWDETTNSYGACTVTECAPDYHVENNTCVPNTRSCLTANGSGYQEWKDNGTWGTCIAEICEAGYEVQNDTCVVCPNALGVSSWAKGCEIAACMYQGERYILENNECIEICFESEYSDETGSRIWNPKTGRCETTCALGHKPW